MPTSAKTFDTDMRELLRKYINQGMTRFLDVGAGSGKYGKMLKEIDPSVYVAAVEPQHEYQFMFKLHDYYEDLIIESIENLIYNAPTLCFDVVIFGDVLEHLPKAIGYSIIEHFIYRTSYIVIVVPQRLIQLDNEFYAECHSSIWEHDDLLRYKPVILEKNDKIMVQIRGYLGMRNTRMSKDTHKIVAKQGVNFRGLVIDKELSDG